MSSIRTCIRSDPRTHTLNLQNIKHYLHGKTKKARANLSGGVRAGRGGGWSCYRSGGEEKQAEAEAEAEAGAGSQGENVHSVRRTAGLSVSARTLWLHFQSPKWVFGPYNS